MEAVLPCALCGNVGPLRDSHVLPAFAFKWLKQRSATGHIRHSDNPNRRIQDGIKKPWLCASCEQRFSAAETRFASDLFHPWLKGDQQRIPYGEWLLRFCVSVSWRVLRHCKGLNPHHQYTEDQERLCAEAERRWRAFLLGHAPHPGLFEQHLLVMDIIESTDASDLPNNINRYLTGAIQMDIVGSDRTMLTFAKLGRFVIFGVIQSGADRWTGTKVHVRHGIIQPGSFAVPYGLLGLFKEKAAQASLADKLSEAQHEKVEAAMLSNIDRMVESDQFRAMMADAAMFGEEAILRRPRDRE